MKIGIITTYFAYNFGAMLQPFALKRTLESMGHEVEMIRYKQDAVYNYYAPFSWRRLLSRNPLKGIKYAVYLFRNYTILKNREINFKRFMLKHITDTDIFCETIPIDKDVYFIGSDQLWNPNNLGGFDNIYMGEFDTKPNSIKATYAISAGSIEFTPENIAYLKSIYKNLHFISVREESLKSDLKKYTQLDRAETVLDPTLLADPLIYDELEFVNPLPDEDFIMLYYIRDCSLFLDRLCKLAVEQRCRLLVLSEGVKNDVFKLAKVNACVTYIPDAGEDVFLGSIKYAKCVFTPSFHGIVFSIIYKTPFYSLELDDNNNHRAQDLLKRIGLSERIISKTLWPEYNLNVDFNNCESIIRRDREYSLKFIRKVLNSYQS